MKKVAVPASGGGIGGGLLRNVPKYDNFMDIDRLTEGEEDEEEEENNRRGQILKNLSENENGFILVSN